MSENQKNKLDREQISSALKFACDRRFGFLDQTFICQSLGALNPHAPVCVELDASLADVVQAFRNHRMGCVLIKNMSGELAGIFSERDLILKVKIGEASEMQRPMSELMTANPVTATFDTTIAFALNLMAEGGFRHLPIVDEKNAPVGIISVKDVIDRIVASLVQDLLNFEVPDLTNN